MVLLMLLLVAFCYLFFLIIDTRLLTYPPSGHLDWCLPRHRKDPRFFYMLGGLAFLMVGVIAVAVSVARRRPSVVVSQDGVTILTNFRDLRIAWRDVKRLEMPDLPRPAHLHLTDGSAHALPWVNAPAEVLADAIAAGLAAYRTADGEKA
ncbi:PH domain-containing protein [Lacibacterium aquatile]|uniref:PH domain-containing protein n=1 Tax=Lacibacterium aquatile TaxID=1168082 RepID=A0ABW5DT40_9PROT